MYQPEAYAAALFFMIVSMVCWGSWANTMKLTPGYAFPLFYWDYLVGMVLGALALGFTLGSFGGAGLSFLADLRGADARHILYALLAGIIFNVANLLLVAAIEIAGLAVAFPIGIGLALVVGALVNYLISPRGNPFLLFSGIVLVVLAIIFDAMAYKKREVEKKAVSARGIKISIACGILMGTFYPLIVKATTGKAALGPYAVALLFCIGAVLCALPLNYYFMRKPLTGIAPVTLRQFFATKPVYHLWGVIGGLIWCTGTTFNFVASHAQLVGPAISYALGQGATMVSAIWGVFMWREFVHAPAESRRYIPLMFLFFLIGLGAIAIAPLYH
ncbi:MAG TPA: GRP family sugar transporter [Verrucomicrobiae bacterium]|nr:GRP family sugar transporter [Verrucomicrobiae bacterium]